MPISPSPSLISLVTFSNLKNSTIFFSLLKSCYILAFFKWSCWNPFIVRPFQPLNKMLVHICSNIQCFIYIVLLGTCCVQVLETETCFFSILASKSEIGSRMMNFDLSENLFANLICPCILIYFIYRRIPQPY